MDFWNNILRYPRFFLSSMIGLILVLISPIIKLSKELKNKTFFFSLFFFATLFIFGTLFLMINPPF